MKIRQWKHWEYPFENSKCLSILFLSQEHVFSFSHAQNRKLMVENLRYYISISFITQIIVTIMMNLSRNDSRVLKNTPV